MKHTAYNALVTLPPYAPYAREIVQHPRVTGIRLNTVMPVSEPLDTLLTRLRGLAEQEKKELWIDLKGRQLRVATYGVPPFTEIKISHAIDVYTPCDAYFGDRQAKARILEVDGDRLIMESGPRRVVGPGESVTIPHPTLRIEGYLTELDQRYIEAGAATDCHNFLLSFVESAQDIEAVKALDPLATIIAKIESPRGLAYVQKSYACEARLMAARGDLYLELHWPHHIIEALEHILERDRNAIAASRILSSLAEHPEPRCEDISDVDNLLRMGYRTVMLGDEVCLQRDSVLAALNVFSAIAAYREEKCLNSICRGYTDGIQKNTHRA